MVRAEEETETDSHCVVSAGLGIIIEKFVPCSPTQCWGFWIVTLSTAKSSPEVSEVWVTSLKKKEKFTH